MQPCSQTEPWHELAEFLLSCMSCKWEFPRAPVLLLEAFLTAFFKWFVCLAISWLEAGSATFYFFSTENGYIWMPMDDNVYSLFIALFLFFLFPCVLVLARNNRLKTQNSQLVCSLKCYKDLHPWKLCALIGFKCERVNGSAFDPNEITGHSGSSLSHCECSPSCCWTLISDAVLGEVPIRLPIYFW